MAHKRQHVLPYYNNKVKITGWVDNHQAYPYDNLKKNVAHYRTLGATSDNFITQTTAKEAMENGAKKLDRNQAHHRRFGTFASFALLNQLIADDETGEKLLKKYDQVKIPNEVLSTYANDYKPHSKPCKRIWENPDLPHPLFHRRPKNEFALSAHAADKFMDTHFFDLPPNRKCINYLRQIKNSSIIFR